jgi:hypothetical protein
MIWDLHCHLSGVSGETPHERIAQLVRYADRMGVERLVFFMGFPWATDPTPDDFRRQNDQVITALEHWHDRAFGFAYLNPKYPEASLQELDRCVRDGPLVGVKLWVAVKCNDPRLDPIIRRAAELKAVIFQHTWLKTAGNLSGESTPSELAELADRHPKTTIICGHTGGNWERGIRAIRGRSNVVIGIGGRSFSSQLAKVRDAEIPLDAQRQILGANLKRLLTPILTEKGMLP